MLKRTSILITRAVYPETVARLSQYFEVDTNDENIEWTAEELIKKLQNKAGVLTTADVNIDAMILDACPTLRICSNMAVGYNNFDINAMTIRGVQATNTPDVLTETTADFGFALLMATARRITESEHFLRRGDWTRWRYDMLTGTEIHGSTLGILGMGRIGQSIARRGVRGFGMKAIYHSRTQLSPEQEAECGAYHVSKRELLQTADHVILTLPYSVETHHSISSEELALMKPTATLINIARGGVVDDVALAHALRQGQIAAAGLDVFENEPRLHCDLLACNNIVLTPHIASATVHTRRAMAELAAGNLIAFLSGKAALTPVNLL